MKYMNIFILLTLVSCTEKSEDTNEQIPPQDTGSDIDDTGGEENPSVQVPKEGFGEIDGECGVLLQSINDAAFIVQNSIDFANLALNDEDLSSGSQEILSDGNLNSGSLYSEIFAFEMLYRCETATLLQTETEIEYIDPNGKKTDLIVSINEQEYGISVTRAFNYPPEEPYTREAADALLEDKLADIEQSSANVSNPTWDRQILSIIAYSPDHVTQIVSAWEALDTSIKGDTIIYVTATNGDDEFIY